MMTGITKPQRDLLHTAKAKLGMDEATYRAMLRNVAGVTSSTELSQRKFQAVLDHLEAIGFTKTVGTHERTGFVARKRKWDALGNRRKMATPAQLARIETDWDMMRWYWAPKGFGNKELALRSFVKHAAGVSDLAFLSYAQAIQVITAIKKTERKREAQG